MDLVERVARPEHTGADRCWPCTVVNVAAVAAVALLVGRRRRGLALALAAVALALVAVRGYVVPYTPRFAPRLVEALGVADRFGHAPAPGVTAGGERGSGAADAGAGRDAPASPDAEGTVAAAAGAPTGEELLGVLADRGVLAVEGEDVAVEPSTFDAWRAEMAGLAALDTDALADAVGEVAGVPARGDASGEREYVVLGGTWLSRPVAVAETAAARVLADRFEDRETRLAAASALRMFLPTCPDCGADLRETTTASCCGGYATPTREPENVLACPECGVWVYRFAA